MIAHLWKLYNTPQLQLTRLDQIQLYFAEAVALVPLILIAVSIYVFWLYRQERKNK